VKEYGKLDLMNMDCMELMDSLPDKSMELIIVDPPYFEVKGEFDFIWSSFDEYLEDVERWAGQCQRLLASNGTVIWWGHAKKIAYTQIILDRYFLLCNSMVWEKAECQTKAQDFDSARTFAPITERFLVYSSQEMDLTGLEAVEKEYIAPRNPFAKELKKARLEAGMTINEVAELGHFYGTVNHGGAVTNWERGYNVPLREQWELLKNKLPINMEYEALRAEYEALRAEYEDKRRYFNNSLKMSDVVKFSQEGSTTGKHDHPTQKPPTLTRALVQTCSRSGQSCLVPFAGSGTEVIEAWRHGLNVTASEIDLAYYKDMLERVDRETAQQELF
jgi:site-specific DNA-methyltransferase (adenine-specific)